METSIYSPAGNAQARGIASSAYQFKLPKPAAWSDISYLRCLGVCSSHGTSVQTLQHIFQVAVENSDTKAIIARALAGRTPTSWANKVTVTPAPFISTTLTADNEAFYALARSPNVRGIAWMLIQHKDSSQLGLK
jgi:hypothetical protein